MIKPEDIPQFTGNLAQLEADAKGLDGDAGKIRTTGADIHSEFQGLSAFYTAPEAEQLFATTRPVKERADSFADDLENVSSALTEYADEVRPIAARLKRLKAEAATFVESVEDDDEWEYDEDKVSRNNDLLHDVNSAVAAFWEAERRAANKIVKTYGGTAYIADDGSGKSNMYGYKSGDLDHAKVPWGSAVDEKHHWYEAGHWIKSYVWDGLIVDGVWGTIKGLGTLVGFDGADAAGKAWGGIWDALGGLSAYIMTPYDWVMDKTFGPAPADPAVERQKKAFRDFGKGLLAWDEWGKNPGRAAGLVTFNVLTLGIGPLKAIGAAKTGTAGKVAAGAAKLGEALDPMVATGKTVANFPKISGVMANLKNLFGAGSALDNALEGAGRLPDSSVRLDLPDGSPAYLLDNGDIVDPHGNPISPAAEAPREPSVRETPTPRQPSSADVHPPTPREPALVGADPRAPGVAGQADGTTPHGPVAGHQPGGSSGGHNPSGTPAGHPPADPRTGHTGPGAPDHGSGHTAPGRGGGGHPPGGHSSDTTPGPGDGGHSGGPGDGTPAPHDPPPGDHGGPDGVPNGENQHGNPAGPQSGEAHPLQLGGETEQALRDALADLPPGDRVKPKVLDRILTRLAEHPRGSEVAEIIASGRLSHSENFGQVVSSMGAGRVQMLDPAVDQLRFADELHRSGVHDIKFEIKNDLGGDIDVLARDEAGNSYGYQMKRLNNPQNPFDEITKSKYLGQLKFSAADHKVMLVDGQGTLADWRARGIPDELMQVHRGEHPFKSEKGAGITFVVRLDDGTLVIPPGATVDPGGVL